MTHDMPGHGHTHDTLEPTEVMGLPPASQIFALACGASHTCVVTENWRVFTFGAVSGQEHIIGLEPTEVHVDLGNGVAPNYDLLARTTNNGVTRIFSTGSQKSPKSWSGVWPVGDMGDMPWPFSLLDTALELDREKKAREFEAARRREVEQERDEALGALRALSKRMGDPLGTLQQAPTPSTHLPSKSPRDLEDARRREIEKERDETLEVLSALSKERGDPSGVLFIGGVQYISPQGCAHEIQEIKVPGPRMASSTVTGSGEDGDVGQEAEGTDGRTEEEGKVAQGTVSMAGSDSWRCGAADDGARLETLEKPEKAGGEGDKNSVSSKGSHEHHQLEFV
jgi:hypothetical protein